MSSPSRMIQDIETLRKRHTDLDRKRAAAEANLRTANEQLDALRREAREQYQTDDLDELRKKLQSMKDENDRKRAEYQQHLDQIETNLKQIEQEHTASRNDRLV